uniref:Cadherin-related family member 1 n=1 Tax=Gasterosteus aculeatus aculeatus TaxID=481459 RepID=A0AAQ4R7M6_GASAC
SRRTRHWPARQSDYAPYFYDNGPNSTDGNMALFSISEDTPVGTQIYTLNGSDPEGDPVRYGLTFEMGSKEYFRADSKSGEVTLILELDREKARSQEINTKMLSFFRDKSVDSSFQVFETVRVFVTDANDEPPEFQNLPFIIDIPEDTAPGSSIYRVQAADRDMGSGGSVSYYLQTSPFAKFTIDGSSGILRVKPGETLDYETTPTHFVTVVAKDGGGKYKGKHQVLTSTATMTINVLDAQDMPPSFIGSPYFGYVYEVSVPGSEIFTVYAKDGDQGNPNQIQYSIMNGSDGVFDINSTSGCITLSTYPNLLRNELYEILDYDVTMVTVRVVDLNNHPPTFYGQDGPQSNFEVTMYEHPPAGEILRGFKITVNDSDQGANAKFKLRLVGPSRVLRVVPQTVLNEAQVTIIVEDTSGIDYEKGRTLSFKLLAVEIDTPERFSATADIVINLLDTNDNIPKFTSEYYIAGVPENSHGGSSVVRVTANDPDSGPWGEVRYTIYGSGSDLFAINQSSGLISTQPWTSLDAEVRSKYNFYVKAEDSEGKYSLSEVFVTVLDMNDHSPAFDEKLLEKTMIIGTPVRVEAVDEDAESPNNVIEYSIMTADPDNAFDINADTGEIKLKPYIKTMEIVQNITEQKDCKWSLVVQARDRGSPSFSTTAVVTIDITEATPLKGPMAVFLMKSRDSPMRVLGVVAVAISLLVGVTALISAALYMRNSKSNRVMPARRIIKRRRRDQRPWIFDMPVVKFSNPADKFLVDNQGRGPWPKPPPPSAPPPPCFTRPHERPRAVPTISGVLASKGSKKAKSNRRKEGNISSALVSELKKKLEQKMIENNQGYY